MTMIKAQILVCASRVSFRRMAPHCKPLLTRFFCCLLSGYERTGVLAIYVARFDASTDPEDYLVTLFGSPCPK